MSDGGVGCDCEVCSWIETLEPDSFVTADDEDRARFASWTVDPHDASDNTLAVEDAADHLAHKLGD